MADQIIDRLGVEFFSKISPDFTANLDRAIRDFQDKIKPVLNQINGQWKSMAINVSAFFRMLQQIPTLDMSKMVNTQGLVAQASQTFKQIKAGSVREMEELSSGVRKELNKAEQEFRKFSDIVAGLRAGQNPIVEWGRTAYSKGKPFWPEAERAIPEQQIAAGFKTEQERQQIYSQAIAEFTQKQLAAYQRMEQAVGRIGAFERARIATQEIVAKAAQDELIAREKIAQFETVTKTLSEKGIIAGKDADYFAQAKKYLEDIWRTTKDINVLNQHLDDIMQGLIGKNERVRDIIMESLGIKKEEIPTQERLVELAQEAAKAYEQARQAAATGAIGAGPGVQAGEWARLIGVMMQAKNEVSEFQKRVQQINLRGFIKGDEFERVQGLTRLMNKEIDSLIAKLAVIGSHSEAAKLAEQFDLNRKAIDDFAKRVKAGEVTLADMNIEIQQLTSNLMKLSIESRDIQGRMLGPAYKQVNDQILALTSGLDLNYKALRRSSLGTLELEKVQGLLKEKLSLIRQEYEILGGKASPELNARFRETSEAVALINHHLQVLTGRTADAARAADRWGVGFKDMLKSQLAWLVGGALIFGTVFKIQQAFTEAVKTILEFRQALVDVGAITEASSVEMVVLEKAARNVATSTKMGFMEAAEALKILGQAGMTARDSAEALKTVAMMVTSTGATSAESVKVLTTAINVWNLSAKESMRVANVMAAALNYSKLEVGDLSTSFNYLASTAAQVGMSLEETVASIAVLSNMGVRASTIGTGLRGVIGQLIAPTKDFKDELKRVGLAIDDIRMPAHNLIDVLRTLATAGFNMGMIFEGLEKRQAAMLTSMMNAGADAFQRMTDRISGTNAMMVMFERSMEGPMARLTMFKNRLLDVALDFTGVLVPGMEIGINILTKLLAAFRDLGPIYAFVAALKIFQYMMATTAIQIGTMSVAMTRLAATFTWLGGHPIFTALALLTTAYIGVKMAMDHESQSRDEAIKLKDREIQATIKQTSELETLAATLKSGNLTQSQARDLVAGLAKEYGFLNDALTEHGLNVEKAMTLAINKVKDLDEELKKQKLERLVQESQKLYAIWVKIDAIGKEKAEGPMPKAAASLPDWAYLDPQIRDRIVQEGKKSLASAREAYEKEVEAITPLLSAYTKMGEAEFKAMLASQGLKKELIDEIEARRQAVIMAEQEAQARKKRTDSEYHDKELEKEMLKLRREGANAYQALQFWREDELDKAGVSRTQQAKEYRLQVEQTYRKKLSDLIEADRKKEVDGQYKVDQEEMKERQRALEGQLADIELYSADEEKIRRESLVKIQLLRLKGEQEIRRVIHEWETSGETKGGEKVLDTQILENIEKLRADYQEQEKRIVGKANLDIAKFQQTQLKERVKAERDAEKEVRQIRQETARAMVAIAKTERDEIASQEMLTNTRMEEENSKHYDRLLDIHNQHATDAEKLTVSGDKLVEAEIQRHNVTVAQITQEGERAKFEATERATTKYIREQKRLMEGNIDEAVRYQALSLRELQKQYDDLSETARNSEFGKKLRNQFSELTVEVYTKHRDAFQAAADMIGKKFPKDSAAAQAAIAELMEGVERYNARVREARRYIADYAREHSTMWTGMADGFQDFTTRLNKQYDTGKEMAKGFGDAVYAYIHDPLNDLFTGDVKNWGDYWRGFCKNLGQLFSKAGTDIIFQITGIKEAMAGIGAGGSFNWGSLFGGAFGGRSSLPAGGVEPINYPQGAMAGAGHGGGFIQDLLDRIPKRHSGGPALDRDEVLMKVLRNEYLFGPRATASLGKRNLDYMNQTGKIPGSGLTIDVGGINVTDNKRMASHLRSEIETTVRKVVVEYAR